MSTVPAPKGAGKGTPRPKSKLPKSPKPSPKPDVLIRRGDLVLTGGQPLLAQVVSVDVQAAILAPLIDTETDELFNPNERIGWQTDALAVVPVPPLAGGADGLPHVLAQVTRTDLDEAETMAAEADEETGGVLSAAQRAEQKRLLQAATDALALFVSLWATLTNDDPSIYAGRVDRMAIRQVDALHLPLEKALRDVTASLTAAAAGERAETIINAREDDRA